MTIYKPSNFIDVYRIKAKSPDLRELSGRIGRPWFDGFHRGHDRNGSAARPNECGD